MTKPVKSIKPPIDWTYYLLISLVFLGVLILLGLLIEIPVWVLGR